MIGQDYQPSCPPGYLGHPPNCFPLHPQQKPEKPWYHVDNWLVIALTASLVATLGAYTYRAVREEVK